MKKFSILMLFTILTVGYAAAQKGLSKQSNATFSKTTHDFGRVAEEVGQVVCSFEFENTGSAPLILNSVRTSCGCTTPSYTKDPILPGKKGEIKVAYSTSGRVGSFNKSITVFTNVPDTTYKLLIKGEVLPRK